ncbi:oligopeptide transport system substrate-binding protein [Oscillibacter sp. PC13]|uniref:peptide ABC transporter substrate-binding protein n=1 Tax=Oscillibacter sp. PC13 TaxID=1855299 RepID=UPI0008F152B0|nr:peptide ABC transporter substrate-binding protein [Oscillibacter sp. PC13]SFO96892.1 oligopeptide transport system substrate-binding protein [Oscillibacter sp. PC13]
MRAWKRYTALVLAVVLCMCTLAGCGSGTDGVTLSVCAGGAPESLDPIYAENSADQTVLMSLYENLMRTTVDVSGETTVANGIAKSVDQEENYDGTVTYTFRLRGAKWSDGRSVKADDFVFAWQRLADPASNSPYQSILSVVAGYDEVQETGDVSLLQVSAKNDNTFIVVLNGRYDWFLTQVCTAPATLPLRKDVIQKWRDQMTAAQADGEALAEVPEKWWSKVTSLVTNGPYTPAEYVPGEYLRTVSNDKYYTDGSGPLELTFRFAETADEAWTLYEEKTVDFVWSLPVTQLAELAAAETSALTPELGTYTVLLNSSQEVLADQAVRQAMTLVIDRNALARAAGAAAKSAEGLVPPGVPGSDGEDFRTENGALLDNDPDHYADLCQQARAILSEAGYDNGRGIDGLEYYYTDEGANAAVAAALTQMWRDTLQIQVTPVALAAEELETALQSGAYTLAGTWISAVGNDAECFLMQWATDSLDNVTGYANSAYDTLLSIIASAEDGTARMGCLHDAEALLLDDSTLAPLYTTGTSWELRERYVGVCRDARGWSSFSNVIERTT